MIFAHEFALIWFVILWEASKRLVIMRFVTSARHNVANEPLFRPLCGENMSARSTNIDNGACVDIRARTALRTHSLMWGCFTPTVQTTSCLYRRHAQAKKREYRQRIRDVECMWCTSPLSYYHEQVGWETSEATTFYKRLAGMIARKKTTMQQYAAVLRWLRCRSNYVH